MTPLRAMLLFAVLIVVQAVLYFVSLLYRDAVTFIVLASGVVTFYVYAARQRRSFGPIEVLGSVAIGLIVSGPLLHGAMVFPADESFTWAAAAVWGLTFFALSNALCLGGAFLLRRVIGSSEQ